MRKRRCLLFNYPVKQIDRMSDQMAGHYRHRAHQFVHGLNLGRFTIPLGRFRLSTVTQEIGPMLFSHVTLLQDGSKRMTKRVRTKALFGNSCCHQNRLE